MKSSKKFKLTLMILICVLIILVGFLGIYSKKGNVYKNILPEYELGSDINGSTVLEFEVDTSLETIYYDKDGNKVDSSEVTKDNEKDYKKEEIPVNLEENLTEDNYKKVAKIMKERLKFLKTDQYQLDLDEKTGKIVLAFEYAYPDDIKLIMPMEGKFELVDSNTEDVILSYSDFDKAEATYTMIEDINANSYIMYINLKLNESGIEKMNNIDNYKISDVSDNTEESKENETESEEVQTTVNKFKVMFDTDEIAEVSYDDLLLTGKNLRIATAKNLTTESSINSALNTNTIISKLATIGKMPVIYNITAEEYIHSNLKDYIKYIVTGIATICIAISIYFVIKYKTKGILTVLTFVTNISLFTLILRLTNIPISLNGLAGIIGLILLNTILVNNILECVKENEKTFSENIKNAYLKTLDVLVLMLIIFVVFSFSRMTVINSMGLLVFWGWLITILGNLVLTIPILSIVSKK